MEGCWFDLWKMRGGRVYLCKEDDGGKRMGQRCLSASWRCGNGGRQRRV